MRREEPAETGSPTLIESLSAREDESEGAALASVRKGWHELGFDPWDADRFPREEEQPLEDCFPSTLTVPLSVSSRGISSRGISSEGIRRVHPSTPAVNRFFRSHGRSSTVSNVERALWATRLAAEDGLIDLPYVPARELEQGTSATASRVFEGFLLLVACKWHRFPGSAVLFSRSFAASWCQVTEDEARTATNILQACGAIVCAGRWTGRARLWLPREATQL
jgi:hypothetical protein